MCHLVQRRALHWLVLQAAQSFTNRPSQHVPGLLNPRYPMFSQHHLSKRGSTENFAIYTVTSFYTICVPSTHQIQNTKILKFKRDSTDDCAIYTDLHLFTQSQPSVCLQPIIYYYLQNTVSLVKMALYKLSAECQLVTGRRDAHRRRYKLN